jgi:hypothetical protein
MSMGVRASHAIDRFVLDNGFAFDPKLVRSELELVLDEGHKDGKVTVISEETLIGDICSEKYWGPETVRRIHESFPEARILLCIREQRSIIYSAYGEYINGGGMLSIRQFIKSDDVRAGTGPVCRPDALFYHHVIGDLFERFGRDSVLILPTELLARSPINFTKKVLEFVGESCEFEPDSSVVHVGVGAFTRILARYINHFRLFNSNKGARVKGGF